jgi:hypothetical protein
MKMWSKTEIGRKEKIKTDRRKTKKERTITRKKSGTKK